MASQSGLRAGFGIVIALTAGLGLAILVALATVIRRSRRRSAEFEAAVLDAVALRLGGNLEVTDQALSLTGGGTRLPRARLLETARRHADIEAVAAAAATLLEQPLRPLAGSLSLKVHGTRVGLHLVDPWVLELLAPEPRLARQTIEALGLAATYRIDGRGDQCVSEAHLREQAIDTRDLHGIALAVLRQKFDDTLVDRLLGGENQVVESGDGSAAAVLLVLPDFLPPRARLAAVLEGPDRLVLEPWPAMTRASGPKGRAVVIDPDGWKVL